MTRPPAFHCALCSTRIAARGRRILLPGGAIVCGPCTDRDGSHGRIYPNCTRNHGLHDHGYLTLSRATTAWLLGKG